MAELETLGKQAQKWNSQLRVEMLGFAVAAETLVGHADAMKTLRHKLRAAKIALASGGRGDLSPRDPINDVIAAAGRQVRDPLADLHIPEFWPPHPDGAALSLLKPKK